MSKFTIVVEGNIGSGKSTFIEKIKNNRVCAFKEPVNLWRNCGGVNLLELVYEDPSKWTSTFQSYVLLTMLELHLQKTIESIKIIERSIFSAHYCFIENSIREKILPEPSYKVLNQWFKWCIPKVKVDLIIYLRTAPEIAFNRMRHRDRVEERSISLQYLEQLHNLHEEWLYNQTSFSCPAPVIILNADKEQSHIIEEYKNYINPL